MGTPTQPPQGARRPRLRRGRHEDPGAEPPAAAAPPRWRQLVTGRRLVELTIEVLAIYVLWPWLVVVYSSAAVLSSVEPLWFVGMAVLEVVSFVCMWVLLAICLRSARWFLIGSSQVVGNAVGLVVPGGNPAGVGLQIYLLAHGGLDTASATTGVFAAGLINLATLFVLPVLALPAIVSGVTVNPGLELAAVLGLGVFALLAAILLGMLLSDGPAESVGRWVQWLHDLLVRRSPPLTGLPERLAGERAAIREALQERWGQALAASALNWLFDYAVLLAALYAVGVHVSPAIVLLAYTATIWLAIVPLTPGGIGFVEAGLFGMLVLAGVPSAQAAVATLAYRIFSYVAPVAIGLPTYWWYHRRVTATEAQPAAR